MTNPARASSRPPIHEGRGDILFAGEPEYLSAAERRRTGIPIAPAALADMNNWSARLGVAPLSAPLSEPAAA